MAISKMANGFYSRSDSYLKSLNKQSLINYIRTIETNWENALITNDIQYKNCKRLLAEERNKAIDEFAEQLKEEYVFDSICRDDISKCEYKNNIDRLAEQIKGR